MKIHEHETLPLPGNERDGQRRRRASSAAFGLWIMLFFCLTGCGAMARNQQQADSHMEIGIAYIQSEQYNSALKELLQAKELGKPNPKLHYLLGIAYFGKGLNELAIGEMKEAIALDPKYSEAHNFLGTIYLGMEKWDLAIESFENALSNILYDTPAMAHYNMGWAYYGKGDYTAALRQYDLALAQGPDKVLLPYIEKNKGIVLLASGRPADALRHLRKSLELMPSLAESYYWIGQSFMEQKDTEKAKAAFQEVIRQAPETEWGERAKAKLRQLSSVR